MREILFRGKRMDNGEWAVGSLWLYLSEVNILGKVKPVGYHVDPSTVGQYTGLTEQNGKRIFEGDVVRYTKRMFDGSDVPVAQVVEYAEGGFVVSVYFLNNWLWDGAKGNTQLRGIEVIGNSHDNPELLKEEPQ